MRLRRMICERECGGVGFFGKCRDGDGGAYLVVVRKFGWEG